MVTDLSFSTQSSLGSLNSVSGNGNGNGNSNPADVKYTITTMDAVEVDDLTAYSAPELTTSNHGVAADVYSLGVILLTMLTRKEMDASHTIEVKPFPKWVHQINCADKRNKQVCYAAII